MGYVKAADRREQLLTAATSVLVEQGYEGLTLRTVAARAGVGLSTLQYVFRTRADLVRALGQKVLADCGYTAYEPSRRGLAHDLPQIVEWFVTRLLADPGMTELLRAELVANVSRHPPGPDTYPAGQPLLGGLLEQWLVSGAASTGEQYRVPISQVATLCRLGLTGVTYEYLRDDDLDRARRDAEAVVATALLVAGPTPGG